MIMPKRRGEKRMGVEEEESLSERERERKRKRERRDRKFRE